MAESACPHHFTEIDSAAEDGCPYPFVKADPMAMPGSSPGCASTGPSPG